MKYVSSFSNSHGNCVAAEYVEIYLSPGEFVELTDTESKTGEGARLLFRRDEWDAFVNGVKAGEFDWDSLRARATPKTSRRIAGAPAAVVPSARRTPEALAYVNGQHAERAGWVPYDFDRFCRRFKHDPADPVSERLFVEFQRGRRDEARTLQGVGTERPETSGV